MTIIINGMLLTLINADSHDADVPDRIQDNITLLNQHERPDPPMEAVAAKRWKRRFGT